MVLKRFEHTGGFRKPNIVPIDKFKPENIARLLEFTTHLETFWDHTTFNFLDEKHLINKDVLPNWQRADPTTGYMECIPVSGDFRDTYNLIAVISANPDKNLPVNYVIGRENRDVRS